MELLIAGDLVPTKSNIELFNDANIKSLLGEELFSIWNKADLRIVNLETPLIDKGNPISKCGPNLLAPTSTIKGIKALRPSLITLANNHILDQGIQGLKSTEEILFENNIPFIGAGDSLKAACRTFKFNMDKITIGVYACAEHEFSIATDNSPGANPFDPLESFDHIRSLKNECKFVIVLYHGGQEHYRYPSPRLQNICRKMATNGADLVVCQHSHCIGCCEKFRNSNIIYGQGNFIFDYLNDQMWQDSILIKLVLSDVLDIEYIPIKKNHNVIELACGEDAEFILHSLKERTEQIKDKEFIIENFNKFSQKLDRDYLGVLCCFNKFSRCLNKILNNRIINFIYRKNTLLCSLNYIECEAHYEILKTILKQKIIQKGYYIK